MTAPATAPAAPVRDANLPRSWMRSASGEVKRDLALHELSAALEAPDSTLWVDIDITNRHHLAIIEKVFRFHPLAIEDTLNPNSRVKLDEYEGYVFLIVRGVEFDASTPDPFDMTTFNLCCFLGRGYFVTTHASRIPAIEAFAERCTAAPEILSRGAARAMYTVLDSAVDAYFPVLDQVNDFIDGLEDRVFETYDPDVLQDIFSVKRAVLALRRHLTPEREVFNSLANRPTPLLTLEEQRYFRDVYDHVLRINETLEQYRDLLSSVLDASLTQISNRLGMVTKGLTVVATISVPFVVVSGMWGMNFANIPLANWPHGFWVMLVVQLGLCAGLLWYLRRSAWL
jgi:magnesium transporter